MSSIATRHLSVRPRGRTGLDDVSLHVPDGTSLAVVGPRGAGKTTLLRALAGLQDHAAGDVLIGQRALNLADPRERGLALLAADPGLHPRLDVFDNLGFAASLEPGSEATAVAAGVSAVAHLLALEDLLELWPDDLDGAQRQRVALGRELVRDSAGYLFDDAFAQQPEQVRPHLRSVVSQWQRARSRTSIYATETVGDALVLGDQVAILHRGELHHVGPPREVYDEPDDVVSAAVLGSPPMNFVPASVDGRQLVTAVGPWSTTAARTDRLAGHRRVIVGVRPEHLAVVADGSPAPVGAFTFSAQVGEVEWRGADQLLYLPCPIVAELAGATSALEDTIDLDIFQEFIVAQVPAELAVAAGQEVRVAIMPDRVHVFDAQIGFDVLLGAA